ncbi:hypothetical protein [Methanobrevibacter sp.]
MEKSNIIISVIIVLCIAAGVTAYGVTSDSNGVFKTLQGIGSDSSTDGAGTGNVSVNTSDSSSSGGADEGSSEGSSDESYSESSESSESSSSGSSEGGSSDSGGGSSQADPTVATYTVTSQNADGGYTITYYNAYDENIGYITYDADGNQIEGAGGAP